MYLRRMLLRKKKKKKRTIFDPLRRDRSITTNNVYEPMHFHAEKQIKFASRMSMSFTSMYFLYLSQEETKEIKTDLRDDKEYSKVYLDR